jgi:signal transduction histidine kinase
MKYNIKCRLTVAFLLVIILSAVITIISYCFLAKLIKNDTNMKNIFDLKANSENATEQIEKYFNDIDNYNFVMKQVVPIINKYDAHLVVINPLNLIQFDSNNSAAADQMLKYTPDPDSKEVYYDANLLIDSKGLLTITSPLIIDNHKVGTVFFIVSSKYVNQGTNIKAAIYIISLFLIPLLLIAILVFLFARVLSRDIIIPLKELNFATERIVQGDLCFEIKYNKNNELGKFCQTFDEMRKALKASIDRQAAYENSRKELIASISHDLRTPISTIKGYADGLQAGIVKDSEMYNRYLSVIKSKTESLDRLIDDLFQFSQLELEKFPLQLRKHNSKTMLEELLAPILFELKDSNLKFTINGPIPEVTIYADVQRIGQVINNLIQNARQYAGSGVKVVFQASIEKESLLIAVIDSGPGIPIEDLPRIFDRFYRGEKSRNRLYGGIGLGLTICKYIIEEHGGRIWAESTPGEGSTFYFTLPVIQ